MRFIIISFILLFIDIYVFRAIRLHTLHLDNRLRYSIYIAFWSLPVIFLSLSFYYKNFAGETDFRSSKMFLFLGAFFVVFTLPKLIIFIAQFLEDIMTLSALLAKKFSNPNSIIYKNADKISRSEFITRIGLIISVFPFAASIYGILIGRFNFNIVKKRYCLAIYSKISMVFA